MSSLSSLHTHHRVAAGLRPVGRRRRGDTTRSGDDKRRERESMTRKDRARGTTRRGMTRECDSIGCLSTLFASLSVSFPLTLLVPLLATLVARNGTRRKRGENERSGLHVVSSCFASSVTSALTLFSLQLLPYGSCKAW